MKQISVGTITIIAFALGLAPMKAAAEWTRFANSNSNVDIDYRYANRDVLSIRANTELSGGCVAAFMHLLEDTERLNDWVERASRATILEQPDPNTHIVHTEFNSFWPIANRDMVTRSTWQYDAESGALVITITDASEEKPASGRVIRMTDVAAHWHLQPTENGTLQVRYQSDANPKGNIPRAIARSAALNAIEKTLNALDTAMSDSDYQQEYHSVPCEN